MLTLISCAHADGPKLTQLNLANLPDGPSMLENFEAGSSSEGFEARVVAAQRNDARISFQEGNKTRITKALDLIMRKMYERTEGDERINLGTRP